jgi:integrase
LKRARYQEGCLTKSKRKSGPVWEYRFRVRQPDGTRRLRCIVLGPVAKFKTETAARRELEVLRANINRETIDPQNPILTTFKSLVAHYREKEMRMDNHDKKAYSTKKRNEPFLSKWIVPRWGEYRPSDIKSVVVEEWLEGLTHDHGKKKGEPLADGTKLKIRNLMSAIFRHGMRYEFLPRTEEANPMKYVRQGGKRQTIPTVLEVDQFQKLFGALAQRERTMVLVDCGSGLRRGELIGLKWDDIDLVKKQMHIRRSVVDMIAGRVKTEESRKALPLDDFLIEELLAWYRITPYKSPEDWVFTSDSARAGAKRGRQPYWPSSIMRRFIQPVGRRLGIGNIGWHTFRHTYSSLLHANGEDPKVVQELLRHASIKVTMDVYTQAVTATKRKAQARVVEMIVPRKKTSAADGSGNVLLGVGS